MKPEPAIEQEVTRLLDEIRSTPDLFDRLIPLVYEDLKRIGSAQRRRLGGGSTLQTTALVHEAFLKLRGHADSGIENRLHLQRLAAMVMRQLILDYARKQLADKRGGGQAAQELNNELHGRRDDDADVVFAVEEALTMIAETDERMAEILAAKLFAGYTNDEIGAMLDLSGRTVSRELRRGRAWLKVELADFAAEGP